MVTLEEKEEVQALLRAFNRSSTRRRSRLFFFFVIGPGYVIVAGFTLLVFLFSAISLSAINKTVFETTYADHSAINALIKLRTSLPAQERFARSYYILKDSDYLALFRQREKEILANLSILQQTGSSLEHVELQRLYTNYQSAATRLWTENRGSDELQASARELLKSVEGLYLKRQAKLHSIMVRADYQRSIIKWTIAFSCTGLLITVCMASFVINRILDAMRRLHMATHRAMTADFICPAEISACAEISDLAHDITNLTRKLTELERLNFGAARYTGDVAIERFLEERLKERTSYAFCNARIEIGFVTAMEGYAIATELLRLTAYLLQVAARNHGGPKSFVSHAVGGSFLIILPPDNVQPFCEAAIASFDAEVQQLFNAGERAAADNVGIHSSAPITSITITTLICGVEVTTSAADITRVFDTMEEAKKASTSVGSRWERVTSPLLTIFLAVTFVAGCSTERVGPWVPAFSRITGQDAVGTTSPVTLPRNKNMSRQLDLAVRALAARDVQGAKRQLTAICNKSPVAGVTDEALFRLALLSLKPASDTSTAERGQQLLRRLKKEFPGSNWTVQAEHLRELMDVAEVQRNRNRTLTSANKSLISELEELKKKLKQLKHLDTIELERGTR